MQNNCKKCGTANDEESKFCVNCGALLVEEVQSSEVGKTDVNTSQEQVVSKTNESTPAEQAAMIINKTNEKTIQAAESAKKIWGKFSKEERIVAASVFFALISFFLPWFDIVIGSSFGSGETRVFYGLGIAFKYRSMSLFPILMLIVAYLIQSSRKNTAIEKIKKARFYILIGGMGLAASLMINSKIMIDLYQVASLFGFTVSLSVGLLLFIVSMVAMLIGGFRLQSKLLDDIEAQ